MKSWMKTRFKNFFYVPNVHVNEQVMLLLESNMPYSIIHESLHLKATTLNQFVHALYRKTPTTYNNLSLVFSQTQMLQLFIQLHRLKSKLLQTMVVRSVYPLIMCMLSFVCFYFFYHVLYPMFLTISSEYEVAFIRYYAFFWIVCFVLILSGFVVLVLLLKSRYQKTIVLRYLQQKIPNLLLFDYYANVFVLVYHLCLSFKFSSLMSIEVLRGLEDYPYLQAIAYDVFVACEHGSSLHEAIMNQNISGLVNQTIQLGIAANDLPAAMKQLVSTYQRVLISKLKRNLVGVHALLYVMIMANVGMMIQIIQIPTKMIQQLI